MSVLISAGAAEPRTVQALHAVHLAGACYPDNFILKSTLGR